MKIVLEQFHRAEYINGTRKALIVTLAALDTVHLFRECLTVLFANELDVNGLGFVRYATFLVFAFAAIPRSMLGSRLATGKGELDGNLRFHGSCTELVFETF